MEFSVLGPVQVAEAGQCIPLRRKEIHLLAVLLVTPGGRVSTEAILDELWGEDASPTRRNSLHVHLSRLRSALRTRAGDLSRLVTSPQGYLLAIEPGELDAARLHTALAESRAMRASDPAGAHAALLRGLAEWRGEPFAGLDSPAVTAHRTHLEFLRHQAVVEAAVLEASVAPMPDVARIHAWLREYPTSESVAIALARGHYRCGDQVAALAVVRDFRRAMARDWGLDVSPELAALERRMLDGDPVLRAAPATPGRSASGRSASVRGRSAPAPSRGGVTPGATSASPGPLAARADDPAASTRAALPSAAPPEREALVREVLAAVSADRSAVAVVVGARGMGRTVVARALAQGIPGAVLVTGERDRPFGAVRDLLGACGAEPDEIDRLLGASTAHLGVADPLGALVAAVGTALEGLALLIVDDVDCLDSDSRRIFRGVFGTGAGAGRPASGTDAAAGCPLVVTALTLAGVIDVVGDAPGWLDGAVVRELGPIGARGVRTLLTEVGFSDPNPVALDRWAERIVESSAGQPFVASALARHVVTARRADELPGSVSAFAARLREQLPATDRRVLDLAVLDAPALDIGVLAVAGQRSRDDTVAAVERLIATGLLVFVPATGDVTVHRGWLSALADAIGPVRKQMTHADLAHAWAEAPAGQPGDVVRHLRAAGPRVGRRELATWLLAEGRAALAAHGTLTAIDSLTDATTFADAAGDRTLAISCRLALVEALQSAGRFEPSQQRVREAAAGARRLGDARVFARAAILAATPLMPDDDIREEAADLCDEAVHWLGDDDELLRADLLEAAIRTRVLDGSPEAGRARAHHAGLLETLGENTCLGDPVRAAVALGLRHAAYATDTSARERMNLARRAVAAARSAYGCARHLAALRILAGESVLTDPETGREHIETYREVAHECAQPYHQWQAGRLAAAVELTAGDWETFERERSDARAHEEWLDPSTVALVEAIQQVTALWWSAQWDVLDAALAGADFRVSQLFEPVLDAARCAVAERAGRPLSDLFVRRTVSRLGVHSAQLPGHVLLAGLTTVEPRILRRPREIAEEHRGEWISVESGLGLLGKVDSLLALPAPARESGTSG